MACIASLFLRFSLVFGPICPHILNVGIIQFIPKISSKLERKKENNVYQVELFQLAVPLIKSTGITAKSSALGGMPHTPRRTNIPAVFIKVSPLLSRELGIPLVLYTLPSNPRGTRTPDKNHQYFQIQDLLWGILDFQGGMCVSGGKNSTHKKINIMKQFCIWKNQRKMLILTFFVVVHSVS